MADRLKQILPQLIAPTQSTFVLGKLITDNVLVAFARHALQEIGQEGFTSFEIGHKQGL